MPNRLIFLLVISLILGGSLICIQKEKIQKLQGYEDGLQIQATIISNVKSTAYKDTYVVKVENKPIKDVHLILRIKKQDKKFEYGDLLKLKGKYTIPTVQRNFGGYDYNKYLLSTNIKGIIEDVENIEVIKKKNLNLFSLKANECTKKIKEKIETFLDGDNRNLFVSLVLADKSELNEEIQSNFRESNLSHILAVSGMHVTYISAIIMLVFNQFINKRYVKIISILILIIYMQMTSYIPSVVRASVMTILFLISGILYKSSDTANNLAISLILILINNPYAIYNLGFQLSYLGTISIIIFQNIVKEFFGKVFFKKKNKSKLKKYVMEIIQVTISANILLFPLIIFNFNILPINFLISNLLVTPVISVVICFGIITILISFVFHKISIMCGFFLSVFLDLLNNITEISSKIQNKTVVTPSAVFILLYYAVVFIFVLKFKLNKKKYLHKIEKNILKKLKKINRKTIALMLFIIIFFNFIYGLYSRCFTIYFVDVGQGDCTLIKTCNNKKILIDGGGSEFSDYDVGEKVVVPYLLDRGMHTLDYIIISHFDSDHVGGIFSVMKKIKVKNILISRQPKDSNNYKKFLELAKKHKIKISFVKKGDKVFIDKHTYFDFIWPDEENIIKENILNNNSIVTKLVYQNFSILFCGDIEEIGEKEILKSKINLNATVLKVAHHGSKSSSIEDFVKRVNPKIALIGVGENNTFGHPNDLVIKRFKEMNTKIYRTDENGEIVIELKNNKINVNTKIK